MKLSRRAAFPPRRRTHPVAVTMLILVMVACTFAVAGMSEEYDLTWHKISGGGETLSTGGDYQLGGTIGQHDAGVMAGGDYILAGGFWAAATVADPCPKLADLNCDGVVDAEDLLILLSQWGECADPSDCPADLDNDGVVDAADLLILLANWG